MHDLWIGCEGDICHLAGELCQPPLRGCLVKWGTAEAHIVTDSLTMTLESAEPADFASMNTALERYLAAAQLHHDRGLGPPVWLGIQPLPADETWRAQVLSGRLEAAGRTPGDRLRGRTQLRLTVTRRNWFEGAEVELPLSNCNAARVTGGLSVSNHDDSGHDNHVLIDGVDLSGELPVRLRLAFTNSGAIMLRNLLVGMNTHSNPVGFDAILEAEAGSGGSSVPAGDCSGGAYRLLNWSGSGETEILTWLLNAGRVLDAGGNVFRFLLRLALPFVAENLWLKLRVRGGAEGVILGETDWALIRPGESLQELGPSPLPPGRLPHSAAGQPLQLVLVARQWSEGAHALAPDYMALLALDGYRRYEALAGLPHDGQLVDDPVSGVAAYHPDLGWLATHLAPGAPLELPPGLTARLVFFQDQAGGLSPIDRSLSVRVWYRPRKRLP